MLNEIWYIYTDDKKPNVTKLWEDINKNNNIQYIQRMLPGYVCVSYTFMYNGAGKYTS